jgi:hypothetical protein
VLLVLDLGSNFEYMLLRLGVLKSPSSSSSSSSMRLTLAECPWYDPPMDERGRPSGVRAPPSEALDTGRGGAISLLDAGRADDMLARELGLLISDSGFRLGRGP